MNIKTVIVEDNPHDASNLADMLKKNFPELVLVDTIDNYTDAVTKLPSLKPDLLFLDINLPNEYTAFDILKGCQPHRFNIIFTTAYDKYAIDAIRESALDYLLKPFDLAALSISLNRVLSKIKSGKPVDDHNDKMGDANLKLSKHQKRIMIHSAGNILFLHPDDIIRVEANGAYSVFICGDGKKITASRSLQFYDDSLDKEYFFRTHRSFLINVNKVKSLKRNNNGGLITLTDNMEVNITKDKLDILLDMFNGKEI